MLRGLIVACACALAIPMQARAQVVPAPSTRPPRTTLPDEVVGVEQRRSPGSIIVTDAIGGAALGALAGGGVAAYRNYVQNEGWGNWERDVLIGAGIGLGVGLVVGVASAASQPDRTFTGPIADQRQTGFGSPLGMYGGHF